jgi:hypothetical protein
LGLCRRKWSIFTVFGPFLRCLAGRMSPVYSLKKRTTQYWIWGRALSGS